MRETDCANTEGIFRIVQSIVSREVDRPCVIGTKLATKVFQDGELLEVNAEKGMIRKV